MFQFVFDEAPFSHVPKKVGKEPGRRREKDFRKDFEGDVNHLERKQQCLGSSQARSVL